MKRFIVAFIFAIGLFVSLPSTSQGSAPPGQVSFVADQPVNFTAMVVNYEMVANYELTFVSYQTFEMAVSPQEGGFVADQELFLEKQHLYLNSKITIESTDFTNSVTDNRLFRYSKQNESQIVTQNIESRTRCTIRADSQVLVS